MKSEADSEPGPSFELRIVMISPPPLFGALCRQPIGQLNNKAKTTIWLEGIASKNSPCRY